MDNDGLQQQCYNKLPWKKKRILHKKYNTIKPLSKVWRAVLIFTTALGVTACVLQIIYSAEKNSDRLLDAIGFGMYCVWLISYIINFSFILIRKNKFFEWLKNEKGVLQKRK